MNNQAKPNPPVNRAGAVVLGTFVDSLAWDTALDRILAWATRRESRCVCCCNVHSVVTAMRHPRFNLALASADMATADGAPIAWMLRRLGHERQQRLAGPDLMWELCALAAARRQPIFLYGNDDPTLTALRHRLQAAFPNIAIAGTMSPPFRAPTAEEDVETVAAINDSGASMVFVSLGCPKQEIWMSEHRGKIDAVMIGVGAAFDYHAGTLHRAPLWARRAGLEWTYRFAAEPRRLWKRYLVTNVVFFFRAGAQLLGRLRRSGSNPPPA